MGQERYKQLKDIIGDDGLAASPSLNFMFFGHCACRQAWQRLFKCSDKSLCSLKRNVADGFASLLATVKVHEFQAEKSRIVELFLIRCYKAFCGTTYRSILT